jgi:uncharacterized protein DUF5335
MSVREIPRADWSRFLDQFGRQHRAWLASIDSCAPGAVPHSPARQRPLDSVTTDLAAGRVVGIRIRFQEDSDAVEPLRVDAPTSVRVDETDGGIARALEIDDARGQCTRIRFRAAALPEALDGVAPGESV